MKFERRKFPLTFFFFFFNFRDVWSVAHTFSFDVSIFEVWGGLLRGGTVVLMGGLLVKNPELVVEALEKHQVFPFSALFYQSLVLILFSFP